MKIDTVNNFNDNGNGDDVIDNGKIMRNMIMEIAMLIIMLTLTSTSNYDNDNDDP